MTDLEKMYHQFLQELRDYEEKDSLDFLLKHEPGTKDLVIKAYREYLSDNSDEDPEELLWYDEWIIEYKEESIDELNEQINIYFTDFWIEKYKWKYDSIYHINIAWWWPHIDLIVTTKTDTVIWKWRWWTERFEKELSWCYKTVYNLYFLYDEE